MLVRGICYPPVEKSTDITLPEVTAGNTINPVKHCQNQYRVSQTNSEPLNETDKITALLQQDNILWVLASFFGFGLLLSLTPCVFPMIPILSGIIVGQKGGVSTKKALIMSIVFVLAMSYLFNGGRIGRLFW
ncbi:Cytochrome c-type biogenesis protein DsbD, protein-disulfide reductase (EC [uncultured Gammaproteobacteria bacterium]|nr:Cytochrome c-type biogenesis protein DsbD, protein-disulfide reductase (EC [uncultured Gammaproteobacteria bacterium]